MRTPATVRVTRGLGSWSIATRAQFVTAVWMARQRTNMVRSMMDVYRMRVTFGRR